MLEFEQELKRLYDESGEIDDKKEEVAAKLAILQTLGKFKYSLPKTHMYSLESRRHKAKVAKTMGHSQEVVDYCLEHGEMPAKELVAAWDSRKNKDASPVQAVLPFIVSAAQAGDPESQRLLVALETKREMASSDQDLNALFEVSHPTPETTTPPPPSGPEEFDSFRAKRLEAHEMRLVDVLDSGDKSLMRLRLSHLEAQLDKAEEALAPYQERDWNGKKVMGFTNENYRAEVKLEEEVKELRKQMNRLHEAIDRD